MGIRIVALVVVFANTINKSYWEAEFLLTGPA